MADPYIKAAASGSGASGIDEGSHTEDDEDEEQDGHGGLFFDGDWMRVLHSTKHLNVVVNAFGGAEEAKQADGNGYVHVQHALFSVFGGGEAAEESEDESYEGGDERGGRVQGRGDESYYAEKDEDEAEHDGEFCHGF